VQDNEDALKQVSKAFASMNFTKQMTPKLASTKMATYTMKIVH
jgi:hypothetical protein